MLEAKFIKLLETITSIRIWVRIEVFLMLVDAVSCVFDVFDGRMQNCETRKDRKRKRHHTTSSVQPHAVFENRSNFVSAPCAIGVFNLSLGVLHTTGLAKSRQQFLIRILCSLHTPSSTKK